MIINVINSLKKTYPDLRTYEQFGEYQLILARDGITTKITLVDMNPITGDLYANYLSVEVTRENGVLKATYNNGSTEFLFSSGDIMYSYDYKRNEKKLMEITQNELYRFLKGDVMDWIKEHFKMKLGLEKLVEKLVKGT
jgi:hypothetical protein